MSCSLGILAQPQSWYLADLQRAASSLDVNCVPISFPEFRCTIGGNSNSCREVWHSADFDLQQLNAIIVRTMPPGSLEQVVFRMNALARLEESGVRVINPPRAMECAVDKFLCSARLAAAGLPTPTTVACESTETAMQAFDRLGQDVVIKPVFGSEGRGILRVSDPDLAWRTFRTLERLQSLIYVQRYIQHPGFDVRIIVLEGRILGGMKRRSTDDFRTNVARNAIAEPYIPVDAECELAIASADIVGTHIAGIDLLSDEEGNTYVIEVNAVPGWQAFARTNRVDVAKELVSSIV